jgi:hypothetical protein
MIETSSVTPVRAKMGNKIFSQQYTRHGRGLLFIKCLLLKKWSPETTKINGAESEKP